MIDLHLDDIQKFVSAHPDYIHTVGLLVPYRPGVRLFMVRLEYEIFTPDTPQNDFFYLHTITWIECLWGLFSFPIVARPMAERIAQECGVKFVGGISASLTSRGVEYFPIQGPHVYNLGNTKGHPAYTNNSQTLDGLRAREEEQMNDIMATHLQKVLNGDGPRAH
jgi:hypothetical protein